ncbi:ATP-binding protein [Oleiphilus sp. HI0125]|uniref:iron-sulfur cluster carrier protein ApbC n=1 Tax=Oleiphilus sp. HI0125 TaxID=1822266 RepID=UPI0007C2D428|nr:iron-sulfur cluster carrier protein ApbC [Oleiphilus sp. HI0125]KZZ57220.1 ATP-binding protein [Oleiphilus sp. HI0125]KZZ60038.1 ATP-binding protein [Oleiphilus sp. HI0125]
MSQVNAEELKDAIAQYIDPYLQQNLYDIGAVKSVEEIDGKVSVRIELPYASLGLHGAVQQLLSTQIEYLDGVASVDVQVGQRVLAHEAQNNLPSLSNVKNIIAVASGKGGVGKSTSAVNLALALAQEGASVGILDADIYGPSVGMMLGIAEDARPETYEDKMFVPIEAHGIQSMSMAYLVTDKTPVVWRGPMVSGALMQLLTQTRWNDLDYLIIDMPPGTGDIQLTLAQKVPVTGSIVVTTPQDIALLDCKKGIEMFRKVNIPVFGVIENMSMHICSACGYHEPLFGEGGGRRIAEAYDTTVLGEMPLHQTIRKHMDAGAPTVTAEPDSEVALLYKDIARKVGAEISKQTQDAKGNFPEIIVSTD